MAEIKYPELKESTMSAELDAEQAAAEKRMREQERKARHDRDMAIFGDVANLFAQGAALHVGGKNVEKTPSAAAIGNERLRKLQESNSKQIAEYARQQIAARENKRKEDNAAMLARYNAGVEQYKREQAQANTLARLEEQERHNRAMEQIQTDREDRLEKQGGSGNFLKITMPDGTEKTFSKKELGDNWINYTYEELVKAGMPRAMKYKINPLTGKPEPYEDISLAGRKAAIEAWSAGSENKKAQPAVKPGSKGAIYTNDKKTKGAIY